MAHLNWRVGEIMITRLVEMAGTGAMGGKDSPLPDATPEERRKIDWMRPFCQSFANTQTLVIGSHFGGATAGPLVEMDASFRLDAYLPHHRFRTLASFEDVRYASRQIWAGMPATICDALSVVDDAPWQLSGGAKERQSGSG